MDEFISTQIYLIKKEKELEEWKRRRNYNLTETARESLERKIQRLENDLENIKEVDRNFNYILMYMIMYRRDTRKLGREILNPDNEQYQELKNIINEFENEIEMRYEDLEDMNVTIHDVLDVAKRTL